MAKKKTISFLFNRHILPQQKKPYRQNRGKEKILDGNTSIVRDVPVNRINPSLEADDFSLDSLLQANVPIRSINPKFIRTDISTVEHFAENANEASFDVVDEAPVVQNVSPADSEPSAETAQN